MTVRPPPLQMASPPLDEEHACLVLKGSQCDHCEKFIIMKLRSRFNLFSRDVGQASAPHGSGLKSWGTQVELVEKGMALSRSSVVGSRDLLDQDVLSLESCDLADSMLLAPSSQEEADVVEEGEKIACIEPHIWGAARCYGLCHNQIGLVWQPEK